MAYISEDQIKELSNDLLIDKTVYVKRNQSKLAYKLVKCHKHNGMKSVVWKAKDDLGNDIAIKIIPPEDYCGHSLIDEMTEASKLGTDFFASIKFFGDIEIEGITLSSEFKAITTEWIDGIRFDQYVKQNRLTVDDFQNLSEKLSLIHRQKR